jgi:hypothetical protein
MFALHETTQRRVCRTTFVLLCAVPTLLTLVGIAYQLRPWRQQDWRRTLAQTLHVRAELQEISHPRPGETVLSALRLADLRSGHVLGSIEQLKLLHRDATLVLSADSLQLQAEQLPALVAAVSTWLATNEWQPLQFRAEQLLIAGPKFAGLSLERLSIVSESSDAGVLRIQAQARDAAGETLKLLLEKKAGTLRWVVDAQQTPLPAWLVGTLVPGVEACGEARFSGTLVAESAQQRVQGKLRGQIEGVDLQQWIGNATPHRMTGTARVELEPLTWSGNSVQRVQGSVHVQAGAASYSLLTAANRLFGCPLGPAWKTLAGSSEQTLVPLDALAFRFQLGQQGLVLTGLGEALVLMGSEPLLLSPPGQQAFPVAQLVNLFHRPVQGWLPDTRAAHAMAEELPLPGEKGTRAQTQRK